MTQREPKQPHPNSPQAREMADESMVRNLAAQAEAIWPQEELLFARYDFQSGHVLDVGCGTGELTVRLAEKYPEAMFMGLDLEEPHLDRARARAAEFGTRVQFIKGDAMSLPWPDEQFDMVVCRHLLQAVPDPMHVLSEISRVLRPGGRAHLLAEDYGMLLAYPTATDTDEFFPGVPLKFGAAVGCEMRIGRKLFSLLHDLGMAEISVEYVVVDTVRVPREVFARIWEAWRDGYTESLAESSGLAVNDVRKRWQEMIDCARDPRGYALWQVPIWTAVKR